MTGPAPSPDPGRLDRLLQTCPVVIYACRPTLEFPLTYLSGNLGRLLGYRREELLGKAVWPDPLVHPDDRRALMQQLEALLREGGSVQLCYRLRHKDGHYVWVQSETRLIRNALGEPLEVVGALLDISEQQDLSRRLETLSEQLPGFVYQYQVTPDGRGCFPYASQRSREIYGADPEALAESDAPAFRVLHPADRDRVAASIQASARTLEPWHCEYRVCHPEGHLLWVSGMATPERLEDGTVVWHGFIADVTQRREAERALKTLAQRQERILEAVGEGIYGIDCAGRLTFMNAAASRMLGWTLEQTSGKNSHRLFHHSHPDGADYPIERCPTTLAMRHGRQYRAANEWFWHRSGKAFPVELVASPLCEEGRPVGCVVVFQDITERREAQQKLERLSTTDELTGAPNRRYFLQRFQQELQRQGRSGRAGSLVMFDIDHFKRVNDRWGHAAGDEVLKRLVATVLTMLRGHDILGRLGGEECAVLLPETDLPGASHFAERLRHGCEAMTVVVDEYALQVTISLGVTLLTPKDTPESALERADRAMYAAKQAGRNRWCVATPEGVIGGAPSAEEAASR